MRFFIKQYNLGRRIAALAFNGEVLERLVQKDLNAALVTGEAITFFPENKLFFLTGKSAQGLSPCENYDVLFINENGDGWVHFSNAEDDHPLVLTQRCNSNCLMCPTPENVRRNGKTLAMEDIIDSVRYIPDDTRHLTITGGEPFLVGEHIFSLLREIKMRLPRTDCLLLTNGRALGYTPYADLLAEAAPQGLTVGIPLHGYDGRTHDGITQSRGGFAQTAAGVRNLLFRGIPVELRIVVSKLNARYIGRIADLIVREFPTVSSVKVMGLEMLGNAAKNASEVWLPYREAFECAKEGITTLVYHGIEVGVYNFPLCAVDRRFHLLCRKSISTHKVRYPAQCGGCVKRQDCGGIFAGTERVAKNDLKPFSEKM